VDGLQLVDAHYDDPAVKRLLEKLFAHYRRQYPGAPDGPSTPVDPQTETARYEPPDGTFVLAALGGAHVGCGGIRRCLAGERVAELKRMWVEPLLRGTGVAQQLLIELERRAVALGYGAMWLDTGPRQLAAIRFYGRNGYHSIPNYGHYSENLVLVSFGKQLVPQSLAERAT
jgi:GNAT superfamily N-acetyltransferase